MKRHVITFSAFNSKVWVRVWLFGEQPDLETLPNQISESVADTISTMFTEALTHSSSYQNRRIVRASDDLDQREASDDGHFVAQSRQIELDQAAW